MQTYNVEYIDLPMVTQQQINLEDDNIQDCGNVMRIPFDKKSNYNDQV